MGNIRVFEKNRIDLSYKTAVTITATDAVATNNGQDYVDYLRDRVNYTGYATTGSTDAALTQLDIDMGDPFSIDHVIFVKHNLKAYTFQYYDGVSYVDFSTPIAETANDKETTKHVFQPVSASLFRLIIQGTMVADADKLIRQLIMTKQVGEFVSQPNISQAQIEKFKRVQSMLSGRRHIAQRIGGFSCRMEFKPNLIQGDQDLIFDIFESIEGRLFSLTGGDDSGLAIKNYGFRNEDYFLLAPVRDQDFSFDEGYFARGVGPRLDLVEVV